eukprot:2615301-Pleurochrysis_carterae.AAC.1
MRAAQDVERDGQDLGTRRCGEGLFDGGNRMFSVLLWRFRTLREMCRIRVSGRRCGVRLTEGRNKMIGVSGEFGRSFKTRPGTYASSVCQHYRGSVVPNYISLSRGMITE